MLGLLGRGQADALFNAGMVTDNRQSQESERRNPALRMRWAAKPARFAMPLPRKMPV
jgi:hypothetical protein